MCILLVNIFIFRCLLFQELKMFGAPTKKAIEGKPVRDEDREAFNALIANVATFAVIVGVIRAGKARTNN